jgi:hypothetical protein
MRNIQSIELHKQNQTLYYFTQKTDIKNVLGKVSARLTEYKISVDEDMQIIMYKLYKTAEGFWYDPVDEHDKVSSKAKLQIKAAIDEKESASK